MAKPKKSQKRKATAPALLPAQTLSQPEPVPVPADAPAAPPPSPDEILFPIVGIGASAGGLETFEKFFVNMPPDCGIAFVLVQHLDPTHESILVDLVKRYTRMPVAQVQDGMQVQPNCIYIVPPNRDIDILRGTLHTMERAAPRDLRLPIDHFFRSLATDQGERAIGIVLSGTGSDGTLGLKAIKGEGGMAMVQEPSSARYDGMPQSAINTGQVDYILTPEQMPEQLLNYVRRIFVPGARPVTPVLPKADILQKVLILLRAKTSHDFSLYKKDTIARRVERRMAINQIERGDDYIRHLQQNPLELETLFRELLIGVTSFFRDREAWAVLEKKVLPHFFQTQTPDETLRVWVPGCSTGEEAYSLAILLLEQIDALKVGAKVQVFATDIDKEAIEKARTGRYPNNIAADVSPERLQHFFDKEGNAYRVGKRVRELVVFAEQSLIKDPPFSRLDLISCRNLLIYLGPELQKRVIALFHYALNPGGFLFLGNSETLGEMGEFFLAVDRKWKIFQRQGTTVAFRETFHLPAHTVDLDIDGGLIKTGKVVDFRDLTQQILLDEYAPPCVIVDEQCNVLFVHGHTGKYLEPSAGEANLNLLRMAREGLRLPLTTALRKVVAQKQPIVLDRLLVKTDGGAQTIKMTIRPILKPAAMRGLFLVLFEDLPLVIPVEAQAAEIDGDAEHDQRIRELEQELRATKEYLQTTIEELETSNEELKSTNEEMQSSNEELQSTNEELETAKEELQSVNEELVTVNSELETKIEALTRTSNDMINLLASVDVATIFLDIHLKIQRFNPSVSQVINLIETDVGRPLAHILPNLTYTRLAQDAQAVLDTLIPKELEVQSQDSRTYLMRIRPYRTTENVIEGVVMTFVDITAQKQNQAQLIQAARETQAARALAESIVNTVRESLLVLDADLRIVSASRSFYQQFQATPEETIGYLLYDLGNRQWDIPQLRQLLEEIIPRDTTFEGFQVEHDFRNVGYRRMLLNARLLPSADERPASILLAIEDVTVREGRGA